MLPDTTPELTDEQIAQIEQARKMIPQVRKQIQRAKLAGIDMTAQEADLNNTEAQLDKLYRVYVRRLASVNKP
jgi:hypothetical protein